LGRVPGGKPYIWLDLACIPQDQPSPEMAAIARNKIANQARIFGSAIIAIAWLSDVDNIKGLQFAAR